MRYKNGDFILDAILSRPDLSNTDKIVFTYWLIQSKNFHPSPGRMATNLSKDRRTVRNCLARLKKLKVIEEIPTSRNNDVTRYRLTASFALEVTKFVKSRYGPQAGFWLEETGQK